MNPSSLDIEKSDLRQNSNLQDLLLTILSIRKSMLLSYNKSWIMLFNMMSVADMQAEKSLSRTFF